MVREHAPEVADLRAKLALRVNDSPKELATLLQPTKKGAPQFKATLKVGARAAGWAGLVVGWLQPSCCRTAAGLAGWLAGFHQASAVRLLAAWLASSLAGLD